MTQAFEDSMYVGGKRIAVTPESPQRKLIRTAEANGWTLERNMAEGMSLRHDSGAELWVKPFDRGAPTVATIRNPGGGAGRITSEELLLIVAGLAECKCTETFDYEPFEGKTNPSAECELKHSEQRDEAMRAVAFKDEQDFLEKLRANPDEWLPFDALIYPVHYSARRLGWEHRDCQFEARPSSGDGWKLFGRFVAEGALNG